MALGPGMKLAVNLAQAIVCHMGVDFGCADVGMPEQLLDHPQVGAMFQQVSGKAVPQHMRRHVAANSGTAHSLFDSQPKSDGGEGCPTPSEEDSGGGSRRDQLGPARGEVSFQRVNRLAAERDHAFFIAFADNIDETGFQVELFQARPAQFGQS